MATVILDMSLLAFDFHSLIDVTTVTSDSVLLFTVVTVFAIFIRILLSELSKDIVRT